MTKDGAKPTTLSESFGPPPTSIQQSIAMQIDETSGRIIIVHSNLLARSDLFFRNYVKAIDLQRKEKFPTWTLEVNGVPPAEFEKLDLSKQSDEINENSKIQQDIVSLINKCSQLGASDIHIDTHMNDALIRVRINGELVIWQHLAKDKSGSYISVIYNTMCDVAESMYTGTEFQDAIFSRRSLPSRLSGVRVTCGPAMNGPFMVLRLLYNENIDLIEGVNPLEQLGYTEEQVDNLDLLVTQPSGIIFIAGPTGSGKSTTLKYIIKGIASDPSINFIAVEDPPEYNIPGVRQMPISVRSNDEDRDAAFGKTIRSALRSDPDRIMIGEIRDTASAIMAITCAQTGHQVWTTVHANGAFSILDRMLALLIGPKYSERQAISVLSDASIVNGLMFQRLAPILCNHCKIPLEKALQQGRVKPLHYASLLRAFEEDFQVMTSFGTVNAEATKKAMEENLMERVFFANSGQDEKNACPHCSNGVTERKVVSELVYTSSAILDDVFSKSSTVAKRRWNFKNKSETLQANARKLIISGKLDPSAAINIVGLLESDISEREES